jgi:hypothetical protein
MRICIDLFLPLVYKIKQCMPIGGMRPLNNSFFRHSGLDKPAPACPKPGESRKSLKTLDPPVKPGDDDITTFVSFCKGLGILIHNIVTKH